MTHVDERENVIDVGRRVRLIMSNLVNGNDLLVMGEHHCSKDGRSNCLHSIHVTMIERDIIIKWGINKFSVDDNGLSPEFYRDILEEPFRRQWSSVISS
jgi:hypothetical protein